MGTMGFPGYIFRNIRFELRDISGRVIRVLFAGFGILLLITFLIVFISLRSAVSGYIEKRIFGRLDIHEIQVMPPAMSDRAPLNLFAPSANHISEGKIARIRKIGGVRGIHRVIRLNEPAMLRAGMMGIGMRTDILVSGVERDFFRGSDIDWKRFVPGERLPVIIPYFALDLYNNFASVNGLPELSKKALTGFMLDLSIGKSSFSREGSEDLFPAKVWGFSDRISSTGIVVPSDFIRRYCREKPGATHSTILLRIQARSPSELPRMVDEIRSLGLRVQSRSDIAEKTNRALSLIDGAFSFIMIIILALTVVAIVNSYFAVVYNRSQEITLKRIVGQSKIRVVASFTVEAALVGALFGAGGYWIGYTVISRLGELLPRWVPLMAGLELAPVAASLFPLAVLLSSAVSAASALAPAVIASNMNLFESTKL